MLRAEREAKERAKMGSGFKPGYVPKTATPKKAGKVLLTLFLIGLAIFGTVMIVRAVSGGSDGPMTDILGGSSAKTKPTPTPTAEPHQYATIANVDSGALVFEEPRRSSDTITKIRKGERVEIVEYEPDGKWCIIVYNDIYAYIQLQYLKLE